jgi:hypothetical protein
MKKTLIGIVLTRRCTASQRSTSDLTVGRLSDDFDFVKLVRRSQSGDISYNLVHIAPLVRYVGEAVKR